MKWNAFNGVSLGDGAGDSWLGAHGDVETVDTYQEYKGPKAATIGEWVREIVSSTFALSDSN